MRLILSIKKGKKGKRHIVSQSQYIQKAENPGFLIHFLLTSSFSRDEKMGFSESHIQPLFPFPLPSPIGRGVPGCLIFEIKSGSQLFSPRLANRLAPQPHICYTIILDWHCRKKTKPALCARSGGNMKQCPYCVEQIQDEATCGPDGRDI